MRLRLFRHISSAGLLSTCFVLLSGFDCNVVGPPSTQPDAAASSDAGVVADDAPLSPPDGDLGVGTGSDVVTIGDSYMRLPNAIQQPGSEGVELAVEAAGGGRMYRKYGYTGGAVFPPVAVAMLNDVIPGQFTKAKQANADIKTVIATGGGNDLSDACNGPTTEAALSASCKMLLDQIDASIDALIADMAMAGVQDVVWVGYGDTATTGQKVFRGALDYLRTKRMARCVANDPSLGLRCHYVDNKARPGLMTRDGFHPDAAGYTLIGKAVWDRMVAEGVRR